MKMKYLRFCFLSSIVCFLPGSIIAQQPDTPLTIVELFTSEGCSSCPAADELLKEMSDIRQGEGKPFIALAFHVTYWNRMGWIDSFSNEAYTVRQRKYQAQLKLPQLYTPQAIVNGEVEFVGSNPVGFRNALIKMENAANSYSLVATANLTEEGITISYELNKEPKRELLNIAIIEKNSERKITRGENKSRTLRHFNVVREFTTRELKKQDQFLLKPAERLAPENMEIVLYVQQPRSMKIISAFQIPVHKAKTNE